jgi:hypothetical protein
VLERSGHPSLPGLQRHDRRAGWPSSSTPKAGSTGAGSNPATRATTSCRTG